MIIAFAGKKFAGKDVAAEALIDRHKFKRIGLADKLKDITADVFQIDRTAMDNPDLKEKPFSKPIEIRSSHIHDLFEILEEDGFFVSEDAYRAVCHEFCAKPLTSLRNALQVVDTDICRNYIADDIWLQYFAKATANETGDIVVTDARFPNERKFLRDRGAILCLLNRPSIESTDTHVSENLLGTFDDYDIVINNVGNITQLQSSVSTWWTFRRDAIKSNM